MISPCLVFSLHSLRLVSLRSPGGIGGGGGGTPMYGLYGDVPLSRVWFLPLCVWNSVQQISVSVWNWVYFSPFRSWSTVGVTFLRPESRCKRTLLLFPLGSRCTFTQTRRFRFGGQPRLIFFSLEQGIFTILSGTVVKLCLFSLEQGQVPRHSAAHPHPKSRGIPPPPPPPPPPRPSPLPQFIDEAGLEVAEKK